MELQLQSKFVDFSLLDLLPFGALVTDPDLRLLHVNRWLGERLKINSSEWLDQPLETVFSELGERGLLAAYEMVLNGQPARTISSRLHRYFLKLPPHERLSLQAMPQSASIHAIQQGGRVSGTLTIIQDATERVLSEQGLLREIAKLNALRELDNAFATYDLKERFDIIARSVHSLFPQDLVTLLLREKESAQVVATQGQVELHENVTIHAGQFSACQQEHPVLLKSPVPHLVSFPGITAEVCAPMWAEGQCLGMLDVASRRPNGFMEEDLALLNTLAGRAALAIHMAHLHDEVKTGRAFYQAIMDHTGDLIYTVDRDLCLSAVNAAWDEFARQNDGEAWLSSNVLGRLLLDGLSDDNRLKWEKICTDILSGNSPGFDEDIPCDSPEQERWLSLRVRPIFDLEQREIMGLVFSTHDITAHTNDLRQIQSANQQLETLVLAGQVISAQLEIDSLLEEALKLIADVFQANCITLVSFEKNSIMAAYNISEYHRTQLEKVIPNITQTFTQMGNVGILPDLLNVAPSLSFLKPITEHDHLHSLMYTVFTGKRRFRGLLSVYSAGQENHFTRQDLGLLRSIASQISLALDNAALYEEQQLLAVTDGLTGLANRRRFDEELEMELKRTKRFNWSATLVMFDVDDFKFFNDTYGHPVGDEVLKEVAEILRTSLRGVDTPARFGGDEFAIIMPETTAEKAQAVIERIQEKAARLVSKLNLPGMSPPVTFSIGVASAPLHANNPAELVRAADSALYQAKRAGKNQIVVYST